jgi:hypothetical protein
MNYGYPATVFGGFGGAIPAAGFGISPFPFGKPWGFGGWPASIGGGFGGIIPATTVATSPFPI